MKLIGTYELMFDILYFWEGQFQNQCIEVLQDFECEEERNILLDLVKQETGNVLVCTWKEQELRGFLRREGFQLGQDYFFFSSLETVFLEKMLKEGTADEDSRELWKIYSGIFHTEHGKYLPCHHPFYEAEITSNGDICTCCSAIMPWMIGNIRAGFDCAWHSVKAKLVRLSVINGTGIFCDLGKCQRLRKSPGKYRPEKVQTSDSPLTVNMAVDNSCNLYCSSCRSEIQVEFAENYKEKKQWMTSLPEFFFEQIRDLYVAGNGECMFSKVYQELLLHQITDRFRGRLHLLTNGQLYNQKLLDTITVQFQPEILISVDAWSKAVYEKLRRGGKHSRIMENIRRYVADRNQGKVSAVVVRFVVQADNYREIGEFINGMRLLGVDRCEFTRLVNGGAFSKEEFEQKSLLRTDGRLKLEYQEYFQQAVWPYIGGDVVMDIAYLPEG